MKDFVEIRPVRADGDSFSPVYDKKTHAARKSRVNGPGDIEFLDNPDFVAGAYVNLRHCHVSAAMAQAGLEMAPGITHHLPLDRAKVMFPEFVMAIEPAKDPHQGRLMAIAVKEAVAAAKRGGATHIEICIS